MDGSARPIFVLGCPRSGTTLLRVMLNAHPQIVIPPENRFVPPLYFRRHTFGRPGTPAAGRRMARFITQQGRGAARLGASRAELVQELGEKAPASVAEAVRHVFAAHASRQGKARWGDKRPAYYRFVDELDRMFPDAQFVHLVRDGRACAASLKRPPFSYGSAEAVTTWLNAMHAGRLARRRLGPERLLELRYEDLVTDPEPVVRRLCAFLDEPFEQAMLHPEEVVEQHVPAGFQQHGQIAAGISDRSVRTWEKELSGGEIAAIERLGGHHLRRLGHELRGGRSPSPHLFAECVARHLLFRVSLPIVRWLDRATDGRGVRGRLARRIWGRLRPHRLLLR